MKSKKEYILVVDVGNSYTKVGVFEKELEKSTLIVFFKTEKKPTQTFLIKKIKPFKKYNIKYSIVGSVVPQTKATFLKVIEKEFKIKPYSINMNSKFSFELDEKHKKELGDDLKALCEYCVAVSPNVIGISYGTAIAAVYLENNCLQGAVIAAGLGLGLNKLVEKASLIKKSKINKFNIIPYGANTILSLESGINHLRTGFLISLYNQIKQSHKNVTNLKCVITGGESYNINIDSFEYEMNKESILIGFKRIFFLNN